MFIISLSLLIVVVIVWFHRDRMRFLSSLHFESESAPRLRISVVVVDAMSVDYVASLLMLESTCYEVVLVADFASDVQSLYALSQRFGLIKVNYTPNGEVEDDAVRGLYRSFRRVYSRLVVVDSPRSERYAPYEVGAVVSKYDYLLYLSSRKTLRSNAIDNLLLELATRPEGSISSIGSRLFERFHFCLRESFLPQGAIKKYGRRGKKIKIDYRILK
ncbi:MAG: hypothetical protein SNI51_03985 [Rikenellaceae bacterium]